MMRLKTVGRRSGRPRAVILGYYEDGPNLITLAMNGWSSPEPAWWLNLQARPEAMLELADGTRAVRAREARGEERTRLWSWLKSVSSTGADLEAYARYRSGETAVVVFEPISDRRSS